MSSIRRLKPASEPGPGHNQFGLTESTTAKLIGFAQRLDQVDDDRAALNEEAKEIRAEAKALGFDVKALTAARKLLKQDRSEREEFEQVRDLYMMILEEQT